MRQSGLAYLLKLPGRKPVYVGVSAGAMAVSTTFGETYSNPPGNSNGVLTAEEITFNTPQGAISRTFVTAHGAGLVDFAIIPHFENPNHADACGANAEKWAGRIPVSVYAIDDNTAIKVEDGRVEVVSEGNWRMLNV
jgi:dipeptidase E